MSQPENENPRDNSDVSGHICETLRNITEERGMSGAELARRAGLQRHAVYRILRGGVGVSLEQLWALADGLKISPVALLPVPSAPGPKLADDEQGLLDAVRADDGLTTRAKLATLLSPEQLGIVTGEGFATAERERLVSAIEQAARGLDHLAQVARSGPVEGGGE